MITFFQGDAASFSEQFWLLWEAAWDIWGKGGWAMGAIFANAVIMFGFGVHSSLKIAGKSFRGVTDKTWRLWIEHPKYREGKVGELLDEVTLAQTMEESAAVFDGLRQAELAPINRELKMMKVCIAAAPLFGLLGTVTGMLATFAALADGQGGEKTMVAVSQGISEALITTMTGLVVALPGLFFQYLLARMRDSYAAFLTRLETGCTQDLHRRIQASGEAA
ncbi:MAG: MotA/TolQ/ExbB proton channel family protein [Planctomycetota bacterium]|nr:MotA/TolQ/ExbB proton channel family protein [Planctomycetota bacterium]